MELYAFLLIGGIWAAFLLPSMFEGRRSAPASSTRNFARSQNLLASVATDSPQLLQRRRSNLRRKRILAGLGLGALATLAIAIYTSSPIWLVVTIVFDLAIAAFVTMLLQAQAHPAPKAPVVQLHVVEDRDPATVRVVAG